MIIILNDEMWVVDKAKWYLALKSIPTNDWKSVAVWVKKNGNKLDTVYFDLDGVL